MLRARLLLCSIVTLFAALFARAQAQSPAFADADLEKLVCKVVDVDPVDDFTQILSLEVQNGGTVDAEPLEFRIELVAGKGPAKEERWRRVQLPLVHRYGRPAPAGGKQTYLLTTGLIGKKAQYRVGVVTACGSTGGQVEQPDLRIGAPRPVNRTSLSGTFAVASVALENPLDADVDVLLRVTFAQPTKTVELLGLRLLAKKPREWIIASRPGVRSFVDSDTSPGTAFKVTAIELVDWSLVAPADPAAGVNLLKPAYEAWYRWPDSGLEVNGRFECVERRQQAGSDSSGSKSQYDTFEVSGRFTLGADGKATVKIEKGKGANASNEIEAAFLQVRRPDFTKLAADNELSLIAEDRIALRGPGWDARSKASISTSSDASDAHDVAVAGGRITSVGRGDGPRTRFETMPFQRGYVVTRMQGSSQDTRFTFGEVEGRLVPLTYDNTVTYGDKVFSRTRIVLSDLKLGGGAAVQPAPPAGDGVEALRALWGASWHLPDEPIVVRAAFEVTTSGTDGMWQGRRDVKGRLEMKGLGRRMQSIHLEFAGGMSPEAEMALAGAFRDRLLMWYGRDFNDREPFERAFAGATIHAADGKGTFKVDNGRVVEVRTDGKLVRGLVRAGGSVDRFGHEVIGGKSVMTRYESDVGGPKAKSQDRFTEVMTLKFTPVGEWLVPTQMKFEHIFGREWGPETIVLKDVKVE